MNNTQSTTALRRTLRSHFAKAAFLLAAATCFAGVSSAQTSSAPEGYRESLYNGVTLFGLDPAWKGQREFEKAIDGDPRTYYDYMHSDRETFVGADVGRQMLPRTIIFHPRVRYEDRMVGGRFEGSNESPWSGYEVLHEIVSEPAAVQHEIQLRTEKAYRYYRYVSPAGSHGNVAEFNMYLDPYDPPEAGTGGTGSSGTDGGTTTVPAEYRETTLYGITVFGIDPAWASGREFEQAFDGDPATFYDSINPNGAYVGADVGREMVPETLMFTPRKGYADRMVGGRFEASNTSTVEGFVTLHEIGTVPTDGQHTIELSVTEAYRYYRYVGPAGSHGNIADFNVAFAADNTDDGSSTGSGGGIDGTTDPGPSLPAGYREATSGSSLIFGLDPSWASGRDFEKAFDGNPATFYDYAYDTWESFVGIDGGESLLPRRIRFTPRGGFEARMIGGKFEGSNTNTVEGYETLYTISSQPSSGEQVVELSTTKAYRYYRYVAPAGSYGNIAELSIEAESLKPLVIVANARTFLALDAGEAVIPSSFDFTRRTDGAGGLAGGELQGSNEGPDSGFYTIRSFSSEPASGTTSIPLNAVNAYRYYRFLGAPGATASIAGFDIK